MKNNTIYSLVVYTVMAGNIIYVLWILYNGISENFSATPVEIVSYIGLMVLLAINTVLLYRSRKK